jgi:uncharacterized lipoprotein NlpE involved in copper resistance
MIKKSLLSLSLMTILFTGCNFENEETTKPVNLKTPNKIEVSCNINDNDIVFFTFGQSNAANSVNEYAYALNKNLIEIHNNKCYVMNDSLLGTNGDLGSVWTRLGNLLLDNYPDKKIFFINTAIGGSAISSWIPGGNNYSLLIDKMEMANNMGIDIDMFLWHQGETDAMINTTLETYYDNFMLIKEVINEKHPNAKILVARATKCGDISSPIIINAQNTLISNNYDIYPGPYTDILGNDYRYDDCHFNDIGANYHAFLWYQEIKKIIP